MSASGHSNEAPRSASDGTRLAAYCWRPEVPAIGRVLLVHGLGEHLGRYQGIASALAATGLEVAGVDLRGFGRSGGRRGHVRRWHDYATDLDAALGILSPGPVVLLAHSMGGLVALDWLQTSPQASRSTALILSGPLVGNAIHPPAWKHHLASTLSLLCPILPFPNGIPIEDLCSVPGEVEAFRKDPLRVGTVTPRWYTEMQAALKRVWAFLPQARLPLQLHIAGEERIIDKQALERLAANWTAPITRLDWPLLYHEILHEERQAEVAAQMVAFAVDHSNA